MAEETLKMEKFLTLKVSQPSPWIGSHGIQYCSTHQPLPKCQISFKSDKKLFCARMDQFY